MQNSSQNSELNSVLTSFNPHPFSSKPWKHKVYNNLPRFVKSYLSARSHFQPISLTLYALRDRKCESIFI